MKSASNVSPEDSAEWRAPISLACSQLESATSRFERVVESDGPRRLMVLAAQRSARRADPGRGRVLLVEDDRSVALALKRELERAGFLVVVEETYEGGRARLLEPWEALVVDIILAPPRSAAELCATERPTGLDLVRQALATEVRCVVLITGWAVGTELERIRADVGAHAALAKPFVAAQLLAAIRPDMRDSAEAAR